MLTTYLLAVFWFDRLWEFEVSIESRENWPKDWISSDWVQELGPVEPKALVEKRIFSIQGILVWWSRFSFPP